MFHADGGASRSKPLLNNDITEDAADEILADASRLLEKAIALNLQACERAQYWPIRDDDPGRVMLLTLAVAIVQANNEKSEEVQRAVFDRLIRGITGPPRGRRPPRSLVRLFGEPGQVVAAPRSSPV